MTFLSYLYCNRPVNTYMYLIHNYRLKITFQLVTFGDSRTEALDTMVTALDSYVIKGMESCFPSHLEALFAFS